MGAIKTGSDTALRDYVTDGVPSSGAHKPVKSAIRAVFDLIDDAVDGVNLPTTIGRDVVQDGASAAGSAATNGDAFDTAADTVIADGSKLLYVLGDGDTYDASDVTLDKIHSVLLSGTADISGVYRKEVFRPNVPGPAASYANDIIPSLHLRRLNAAYDRGQPLKVVLWGDSISTYKPGSGSARMDLKVEAYRAHLLRMFPGATINFYNRSWGGRRYTDWDLVSADTSVYTWNDGVSSWAAQVGSLTPHLVILAFGMNLSSSIQELVDIRAYLTTIGCDVLWETNLHPNLTYGSYTTSILNNLDQEAGMTRSYARYIGDGLVDFHRQALIVRDGYDIRIGHTVEGTKETVAPANTGPGGVKRCTGTQTAYNWKMKFVFDASGWADGATDAIQASIGSATDYLQIKKSAGGFWTFQWVCSGSSSLTGTLYTSTLATTLATDAQFTIEVRDDIVHVFATEGDAAAVSEEPVYVAQIVRKTILSAPYMQIVNLTGADLTDAVFWYTEQRKNLPLITNKELWDSSYYPSDGGINHPTTAASDLIYHPVLQQLNFRYDSGSIFFQDFSQLGTLADTSERTLATKTVGANTIRTGHRGEIRAYLIPGSTGNTKNIYVKLGGSTIYTYTGTQNAGSISVEIFFGVDSTYTWYWGTVQTTAGTVQISGVLYTSVWAASTTFAITALNGTAALNDVVLRAVWFQVLPRAV